MWFDDGEMRESVVNMVHVWMFIIDNEYVLCIIFQNINVHLTFQYNMCAFY